MLQRFTMKIHIIKSHNKYVVYKEGAKRAYKLFDYAEQAYLYAINNVNKITSNKKVVDIIVHNADGTIKFKETIHDTNTPI